MLLAVVGSFFGLFGETLYKKIFERPTGPPVRVDRVALDISEPGMASSGKMILSAEELQQLNTAEQHFGPWLHAKGATALDGAQTIRVTLGNRRDTPLRVVALDMVDRTCGPPLSGTLFESPTAGDEGVTEIAFDLDLDTSDPTATGTDPDTGDTFDFFDKLEIRLEPKGQASIDIVVHTLRQACTFAFEATVLDGKDEPRLRIDHHGKPFSVTARRAYQDYQALYVGGVATGSAECPVRGWVAQRPDTYDGIHCTLP
ncbi:hypothetical protein ACFWP3_34875 [Streptomyces sp. NPDC058525]|uniref:hypothetical protein n=1 Tax=Streptomyces sp. NPDC058525 TaxID=3346538 RepID=UPI0036469A9F